MARKSRKPGADTMQAPVSAQAAFDVGAYVRLSAEDRKHKGDSIEIQQAIIAAFLAERPGLALRETYIDNGASGTTFERPAFQKMLADAESGKINCLVTKDLSRLGRNAIDTGFYIEKYFPTHGLRFIAVNDGYDSDDIHSGGIAVALKNMINETYALEIGRKIRATKQMNIRGGAFVGRVPPYGYMKSTEDSHKLVIDGDAAPNVLVVFEMASSGSGVSAIVKHLNDSGILPPRRYFHGKGLMSDRDKLGHVHWSKGAIYGILHNRVYCGDMVQGKHVTIDHVEKLRPQSEWVITENTHEPIVNRELWAHVQRLLGTEPQEQTPYSENIFLRKIFCGHCGYAMRRTRHKDQTYGFRCDTRLLYDKSDCVQVRINENDLKEELLAALRRQIEVFADKARDAGQSYEAENAELRAVRQELGQKSGFLKGLYESFFAGDITADEYREMKQAYETRIASLSARERLLGDNIRLRTVRDLERRKAFDAMGALHGVADLTSEALDALVDRIEVYEDKSLEITFRFRDETGCEREGGSDA